MFGFAGIDIPAAKVVGFSNVRHSLITPKPSYPALPQYSLVRLLQRLIKSLTVVNPDGVSSGRESCK